MVSYKVKIGLAPCRRNMAFGKPGGIWSKEAAYDVKKVIIPYIEENFSNEHIEFVDLDWFTEDGMMYDYYQAEKIADRFKAEKIDALFIANINFGCEEVAGKLAQLCGVPTLIWAVQDEEFGIIEDNRLENPDYGRRLLDAQCGLFATSKILQRYGVKFTALPTCKVDDPEFKKGFEDFAAVACMLKNWKTMRVLQLGNRPLAFTSMIFNEDELLEKFGIEVFPVTTVDAALVLQEILDKRADELPAVMERLRSYYPYGDGGDDKVIRNAAAIYLAYKDWFEKTGCSAISCDGAFQKLAGRGNSLDIALAMEDNMFVTCESDMLGAIQMVLMSSATFGEKKPFFGEFTANHPTNPNAELIWHMSIYPPSTAGHDNFEPYLCSSDEGVLCGFEVAKGNYTLGRLDCMNGKYSMLLGNFKAVDGPFTRQCYVWGEFKDWKKFELATMYGPYVHHLVEIEGDERLLNRMKEFCRYAGIYADCPDERDTPFAPYFYDFQ